MGAKIGSLNVDLTLETARFRRGLSDTQTRVGKAGKDFDGLNKRLGGVSKTLIGLGAAFAGSAIIGGLKDMVTHGLEFASALGETAQQLGVTTKELQEYRYVASQVGIDQGQMDKGLAKLSITLGELARGSKGPTDALQRLGFNAGEIARISKMTAGEALPVLADAFTKIESPAQRAELAAKLFGDRLGPKFLSLLEGGSKGIGNLRDEAHKLGIVLSDKQIQNADETADKMAALQTVLSARIAGFVADNADEIYRLAEALLKLADAALSAFTRWTQFSDAVDKRSAWIKRANANIEGRKDLSAEQKAAAKKLIPGEIDRRMGVKRESAGGIPGIFEFKRVSKLPSGKLAGPGGFNFEGSGLSKYLGADTSDIVGGETRRDDYFATAMQNAKGIEELSVQTERWQAVLQNVGSTFGGTAGEIARLVEQIIIPSADSAIGRFNQMQVAMQGVTSLLQKIFGKKVGGILGIGLQLLGSFGGMNVKLPGFATGTLSAPSGWAMVGERGPELVNFRGGERVFNNRETMSLASRETVVRVQLDSAMLRGEIVQGAGRVVLESAPGIAQGTIRQIQRKNSRRF